MGAGRPRRMEGFVGTFLVAISGYGQEPDRARSRLSGFAVHLVKSVDFDALLDLLAERFAGVGEIPAAPHGH
jgi:hypothetical protein